MNNWLISRRTLLKAGTFSLALPFLDVMAKDDDSRLSPPKRFVGVYFPNGVLPDSWQSSMGPEGLVLKEVLSPLATLSKKTTIVKNISHPFGKHHIFNAVGFLSGTAAELAQGSRTFRSGTSIDQIIAGKQKGKTNLHSLHLGIQAPEQGTFEKFPRSHGNSISWTESGRKIEPQIFPQAAFDSLFGYKNKDFMQKAADRKRIVDSVWPQTKNLMKKVSDNDKHKLNQYIESVYSLESKLSRVMNPIKGSWEPIEKPDFKRPASPMVPDDHEEYVKLMIDILVLGLWTDTTRVSTLMLGNSLSRLNYKFLNAGSHHDMSHHRNDPLKIKNYDAISSWFVKMSAYLIQKMDMVNEGGHSLLDNSLVMFGSGMKDGNIHEDKDLPILLGGGSQLNFKNDRIVGEGKEHQLADLLHTILYKFKIDIKDLNNTGSGLIKEML